MTLAAINWISISINLLMVVFVIVCLLMTLLILMQRPKQEGLGAAFGGGVTDQVFGARTTNVLQRGTVYLGSLFFIISLALAVLIGQQNKKISIAEKAAKVEQAKKDAATEKEPAKEETTAPKSLSEELPAEDSPKEETPATETPSDAKPAQETPATETPAGNTPAPSEEKSGQP